MLHYNEVDLYFITFYSINLMTVMGSLTNIAKQRPVFYQRVVQAFEALHGKVFVLFYL